MANRLRNILIRQIMPRISTKKLADPLSDKFSLDHSPFYLLAQAQGVYEQRMERSLKAVGMDLPRWRVLMVVSQKSPSTISEIAKRAVMKLSTMTKVAQRLAKEGFVQLAANPNDARSTDVFLTDQGKQAVQRIRVVASRIYNQATTDFTKQDLVALNDLLHRLTENMD